MDKADDQQIDILYGMSFNRRSIGAVTRLKRATVKKRHERAR